ncbi:MAG TPA: DUF3667 domain-containing protein [Lutibacter sp.]|nr:DUF3667 domain-containing protein [Lutibacter sp.]
MYFRIFCRFLFFRYSFFKTIVPLLFKPGKVSKEYIEGKRRKYTNPFQLYLHTSIVFFLLMGLNSSISNFKKLNHKDYKTAHIQTLDSIKNSLEQEDIQLNGYNFNQEFQKKIDSFFASSNYKKQFNSDSIPISTKDSLYQVLFDLGMQTDFFNLKNEIEELKNFDLKSKTKNAHKLVVKEQLKSYFRKNKIQYNKPFSNKKNRNITFTSKFDKLNSFFEFYKTNKEFTPTEALDSLGYKKTRMNFFLYQKVQDANKLGEDKDFQKMYLKSIVSKISIALFFLLPILTLLYSLLYIRHRYGYTEHLVVVFNIQTVFFILLIVGILLDALLKTDFFTPLFQFLFVFYVYKTLRNFYKQGRFKTIIKFIIINMGYFFMAVIGVLIISFLAFVI